MEALRFIRDNIGAPGRLEALCILVVAASREPLSTYAIADEVCMLTASLTGKTTGHVGETMHKLEAWGLASCAAVEGDKRGTLMWSSTPAAQPIARELADLYARLGAVRVVAP